jgi:sulfite exporter TauE/SafE
MGFGLHLLTGTIIGAVLGTIGIRWKKIRMLNPIQNTLTGMGAGMIIWLVLFLPLTSLFIQPSIQRIVDLESELQQYPLLSEDVNQLIQKIALGAIAFHLIWGAIFSYIMRSLVRIREFKIRRQQQ